MAIHDEQVFTLVDATDTPLAASADGEAFDVGDYTEMVLLLNASNVDGTDPTLDIKLQTSADGVDWFDLGSQFAQIDAAGKAILKVTNFGRIIRAVSTVGGTDPEFTFKLQAVAKT